MVFPIENSVQTLQFGSSVVFVVVVFFLLLLSLQCARNSMDPPSIKRLPPPSSRPALFQSHREGQIKVKIRLHDHWLSFLYLSRARSSVRDRKSDLPARLLSGLPNLDQHAIYLLTYCLLIFASLKPPCTSIVRSNNLLGAYAFVSASRWPTSGQQGAQPTVCPPESFWLALAAYLRSNQQRFAGTARVWPPGDRRSRSSPRKAALTRSGASRPLTSPFGRHICSFRGGSKR